MVVLIDTNIIIDFLLTREPFYHAAAEVITRCASRELTGYIITRNTHDYINSEIPAILPEDFLKIMISENPK